MKPKRHLLVSTICLVCTPAVQAADFFWDNAGGTANGWGSLANWSTDVGGGTDPAALPGAVDLGVFSASTVAAGQTVNLNDARSLLGLSFTSGQAHTLQGGGTNRVLTLAGSGINKTGTGAVTLGSATAGQQVSLALSANQTFQNNNNTGAIIIHNGIASSTAVARILTLGGSSTAANQINGVIANNGSAALTLNKTGAGLWILGNTSAATANTYTGGTNISGGTLRVDSPVGTAGTTYTVLGTGLVSVSGGATLQFNTGGTTNSRIYANAFSLSNGNIYYVDGNTTLSGGMVLAGTNEFSARWDNKNMTITGAISGSGSIVKSNNTTTGMTELILAGNNTFNSSATGGILRVSGGAIRLTNSNALGATPVVLVENTGTPGGIVVNALRLSGNVTIGADKTLILRNGGNSNARSYLTNVSDNNTWAGGIILENQALQGIESLAGSLTISGNITNSATSPSTAMFLRGASGGNITGNLFLPGANIAKTDGGTWTISSSGNDIGSLNIANGGIILNNANTLPAATPLVLSQPGSGTGTLTINAGFSQEFSAISNVGSGNGSNRIQGAGALSTGSSAKIFTVNDGTAADDLTITTAIIGTGGLTKDGAGTLHLQGNTLAPAVTLAQGTLRATAATFSGGLATHSATTLAVAAGTTTASTLALDSGTVNFVIGASGSGMVAVSDLNGFTQSGATAISFTPNGGFATATTFYPLFTYSGTSPGTSGFTLGALPGRLSGSLVDNGSAIGLSAAGERVIWTGATDGAWDLNTTANWKNTSDGLATNFLSQDDVVFNNDGIARNIIALTGTIDPTRVEFAQTVGNTYTIASGTLSGAGAMPLSQTGAGTTILANPNTYTGATTISAGTLRVDHSTGSLTGTSGVIIEENGTLRLTSNNTDFTFNRNLSGSGTVILDANVSGTAGSRAITLTGDNTGFTGTLILQPSGTAAANGTFRSSANQARLGSANIIVKDGAQLWQSGDLTNAITITGAGYSEAAGGTPAGTVTSADGGALTAPALAYGGIGAIRLEGTLSGPITLDGTAKLMAYNSTRTISGPITTTNAGDDLVLGGGGAASTLIFTGDNSGLNRIWINGGGTTGNSVLQIGANGTSGTLGSGDVILYTDAVGSILRMNRSDGYTLAAGQKIIASHNGTAANLSKSAVEINTTGTGFTLNGGVIDLSDGTNAGNLRVGTSVSGAILNIDPGSIVDVGSFNLGDASNISGIVNQTGGTVTVNQMLRVGHWPGNTSTYNISDGSLSLTGSPGGAPSGTGEQNGGIYVGIDGAGIFKQTGGTVSTNFVVLDNRGITAGADQYNLSGGVLELKSTHGIIARNTDAQVTWNGGTIRNTASSTNVVINTPIAVGSDGGILDTVTAANSFTLTNDITGTGTITLAGGGLINLSPDSNAVRTGVSTGTGTQTISAAFAGGSAITKFGSGTTILSGVNLHTGETTVSAGRLDLTGSIAASALSVADGATLAGEGTAASITLGSSTGMNLIVDASTLGALTSTGTLSVSGTVNVSLIGTLPGGNITVLNHGGTTATAANFSLVNSAAYRPAIFDVTASNVTLSLETKDLVWNGATPHWETGGADNDWNTNDSFYGGDRVTFSDAPAANQTIAMVGALQAASVTFTNTTAVSYSLTGSAGNGIAGIAQVVKSGIGTVNLGGDNTFTGGLLIEKGMVNITSGTALGGNGNQITVEDGGQLNFKGVAINSARSYTATISGVGPDNLGAITNDTAAINENSRILHLNLAGDASIGAYGGTLPAGNRIDFARGGTINGGGHTLTKLGEGMVAMRGAATDISYIVSAGILRGEDSNLALGSTHVQVNTGATLDSWGERNFNVPVTLQSGSFLTSSNSTGTWSGPVVLGGTVNVGGGGSVIIAQAIAETASGLFTKSGSGTVVLAAENNIDRKFEVTGGILRIAFDGSLGAVPDSPSADAITLSGGGRIQGGGTSGSNLTLHSNRGITLASGDGGFHVWTGFSLSYGGAISGSGNFTKTDGGTLVYSGTATHTGSTKLNAGTTTFQGATLASTSGIDLIGGSVVNVIDSTLTTTGVMNVQSTTFNIQSGTITTGTFITANASGAASVINHSGGTLNITGTNNTNTTAASFLLGHWGAGGASTVYNLSGGVINSPGAALALGWDSTNVSFVQSGGTANLLGINLANTRNAPTSYTLSGGRLNLGATGITTNANRAINTGGGTVGAFADWSSSQAIRLTGIGGSTTFDTLDSVDALTARTITLGGALSGSGGIIKTGAGTVILSGGNTYTGATVVSEGTLRVQGTLRGTSSITVGPDATLQTAATNIFVPDHGTPVAASRIITLDGGTWTMEAGDSRLGNVTLNNAATWTSSTTSDWGNVLANTTGGAANITIGGSGASIMDGTGGIRLQGVQNFIVADTTNSSAADLIVSMQLQANGNIGGALGGINKSGGGTLELQGQHSYAGTTTVTEGSLIVNGNITGAGIVSVLNSATLGGNGTLAGAVGIASGAFLAPGNSIGDSLGLASLDLDGTLLVEWNTAAATAIDFFAVSGAIDLDAGSAVTFTKLGTSGLTSGLVFAQYGSLNGTFGQVNGLPAGFFIDYNYLGENKLAVVPEPSTALLTALGALGLTLRRRRQVKS